VDLSLDDTQLQLKQHYRGLFTRESPRSVVRRAEPLGYDEALWRTLAESGDASIGVPVGNGGGGARCSDLVICAQEAGRHLAPAPLIEHATACHVLALAGQDDMLQQIVEQGLIATLSLATTKNAVAPMVPAGAVADVIIAPDSDSLLCLWRRAGKRPYRPAPANLGCSPLADVDLNEDRSTRTLIASGGPATELFHAGLSRWRLLTAAGLTGIGSAGLELGVDYVKQRRIFGVPVGSFQAVRHRLADLAVANDGAELLVHEAAWAVDANHADAARLSSMAFIFAAQTAFRTCRESLQFHGGYGFTLEYDIQLYFRRAKAWPLVIGDMRQEYQRLADQLYPADIGWAA
jgi:alkylation response protein AidB-like acyl-CoA dehydrogenase